jgi:hypothetical protein
MRLLYVLSAAGFALFLTGLYSARRVRPQKRTHRSYAGPEGRAMAQHAA